MKHQTYEALYETQLGYVNKNRLLQARVTETDPLIRRLIDMILNPEHIQPVKWDTSPFLHDFRTENPRKRLHETFISFIIRIVQIIKEDMYMRTFQKPESYDGVMAWISILRNVLLCSLALLYNVRWTPESICTILEPAIFNLLHADDPLTLRNLMNRLGITILQQDLFPAEQLYEQMLGLNVGQFGSFFWRFLHWMAEAVAYRGEDMKLYKTMWKELIKGPLYRLLKCRICMFHFQRTIKEIQNQLSDENTNIPQLFFNIHNFVNALRREQYRQQNAYHKQEDIPQYTQEEYQKDSVFMVKGLSE